MGLQWLHFFPLAPLPLGCEHAIGMRWLAKYEIEAVITSLCSFWSSYEYLCIIKVTITCAH